MARARTVDPTKIVWVPPEVLDRSQGEYRVLEGEREENGSIVTDFGSLAVWVDDAPDDPTDGAGHFEVYNGAETDYAPIKRGD